MDRTKVLIYSPAFEKNGVFKSNTVDGESLYLGSHLQKLGNNVYSYDAYSTPYRSSMKSAIASFQPEVIVINIWKTEFATNQFFYSLLNEIAVVKSSLPTVNIVLVGSIAVSYQVYFKSSSLIDCVISQRGIHYVQPIATQTKRALRFFNTIKTFYDQRPKLSLQFLTQNLENYTSQTVFSVYSSRGCKKGCSFCAYNKDNVKRQSRPITDLIEDISILNVELGATSFALGDSNFGSSSEENLERATILADGLKDFRSINLSMNISADGLSQEVIGKLKEAHINVVLIGLESLDTQVLTKLFNKDQDNVHVKKMVSLLDNSKITPVVSYILFQPYLTFESLKQQISKLDEFGRHHIVQFMSNSFLHVIPGTKMFRQIQADKLLIENEFEYKFQFLDNNVEEVFFKLRKFYANNISTYNTSHEKLAQLKILEWKELKKLTGTN